MRYPVPMAYAPALVLLLFTAWAGTFEGAASAAGATVGGAALLIALVWGGLRFDPLGLGRGGRYLLAGLLVVLVASAWASPVPRAGLEGLLLLPAWMTLPAAVALCWQRPGDRRRGLLAVAIVVLSISFGSLVDWIFTPSPRPSRPLGHHNFIALWLVSLLPLMAPIVRTGGWSRGVGIVAGIAGLGALFATRSLAGLVALLVPLGGLWLLGRGQGSRRRWVVVGILVGLAWLAVPRGLEVIRGEDPSAQARQVYLRAGLEGARTRPLTGWGPRSTPWTLALFLDPVPGVNPPSEVVGQLHSLPVQIVYEIGLPGFLLVSAIFFVFILRRGLGLRRPEERWTAGAGLCGLGAGAVASLGTAGLSVTALPVAWAVTAGAALAASGPPTIPRPDARTRTVALIVAALILVAWLPWLRARHLYEQSAEAPQLEIVERRLEEAVDLDPAFPLYRARWAWAISSAEEARQAAVDAIGVAPLWLQAGVLGLEAGAGWTEEALRRACRLDPFSPFAPWFLARSDPTGSEAPIRVARALLLEPRLAAGVWLEERPVLLAETRREVLQWDGVDPALREAVADVLDSVGDRTAEDDVAALVLTLEARPDQPFALTTFHRISWPARLAAVPVRADLAGAVDLPSAASRPETTARAFRPLRGCR